ncbi:30-kDa cleavage and polyadenylation specificity factor 30 [Pseudocercospora fuligena]|uniref:30-kDa cleavage and polyadenylation specificity factor 30 n=1 Tax=Pseudocercospora fuligena TaxID=685502 RepID=A0A8H6VIP4_9PEZI|nr:30-kDa cleavage and polyadenylation specificity factor 30 [Pseudocercospora fuligena]
MFAPFQSQLEYLSQNQNQLPQNLGQYGQPFDMGSLAGALPAIQPGMSGRTYGNADPAQNLSSPTNPYQTHQGMAYSAQRSPHFPDPAMLARMQQQQFLGGHYAAGPSPVQRQQPFPLQHQMPYSPVDPYGYGLSPTQFSPIDPRFGPQAAFMMPGMPADPGNISLSLVMISSTDSVAAQYARRGSADTAPIPNFPRGPPRKPKQSGHALWVGNLPPAAQVLDLKDHFSRDATNDIESVFLIAKSNCAFVNYKTEAACTAAMNRFHDSRFHGVRLVCRLRRGTASNSPVPAVEENTESPPAESPSATDGITEDSLGPTIARSQSGQSGADGTSMDPPSLSTGAVPPPPGEKVPEKYFIVKSLTTQDLEASVQNGTWATQSHNEDGLNKAYDQAENVYLIFSANKSGEYFGYARMASTISGEPINLSSVQTVEEVGTDPSVSPRSMTTQATSTAPKGRIIDDSARGTIFWEADHSEDDGSPAKDGASGQNWGRQFKIQWQSTNRLPFYRTRGLRNPWNANREVKIARDGTELEPSVGRRLITMFQGRPSPSSSAAPNSAGGMPFR